MLEGFVPWPDAEVDRYKRAGYWEGRSIAEHLAQWVEQYRDIPALALGGKEITYGEMDEKATRLAFQMARMGVRTYDRVIMQLTNNAEFVYVVYACMKLGAIPVCTLVTHRWAEISYLARAAEAVAHVIPAGGDGDFDFEDFAEKIRDATPTLRFVFADGKPTRRGIASLQELIAREVDLGEARRVLAGFRADPMYPAFFQLSGGTTGVPKIIARTHNDYAYAARCLGEVLDYHTHTRLLLSSPVAHNAALINGLLPVHGRGGALVLSPSLAPEALLKAMAENRAETAFLFTVQIHRIMALPEEVRRKHDLGALRRLMGFWPHGDPEVLRFLAEYRCGGIQTYGMTEGLVCWGRWTDPEEQRHFTNGRPSTEADETRIVDPATEEELPVGQTGHMLCRGACTIRGYYRAEERNKEAFTPEGFYRTGDLVRKDENGNLTWQGRIKDCIDRGGEKVNAEEVESHIGEHPAVSLNAVVGMPDKAMGERICVFVVCRPGAAISLEELNEFLLKERGIARFKLPERLELLEELPVTQVGKFEKKSLRELVTKKLKAEGKI
ncbi:MAG: AMP-binding protein [Deltaproteobacteria bacterium]|nr:AMP-binding protein [Deltaproteobacteria bacterium]